MLERLKQLVVILLILSLVLLGGCQPKGDDSPKLPEGTLLVQPVNLFQGDEAKYKDFLGEATGVKLQYEGQHRQLRVIVEEWENGELINSRNSIISELSSPNLLANVNNQHLMISIDDSYQVANRMIYVTISDGTQYSRSGIQIEPKIAPPTSVARLQTAIEMEFNDLQPIMAFFIGEQTLKSAPLDRLEEAVYEKLILVSIELIEPLD